MSNRIVSDQQAGFAGGLNSVSDPAFLGPDQARRLDNIRLSNYGAALKRLGTQLVQSAAITTFDSIGILYNEPPGTTGPVYGGIYWPFADQIYVICGDTGSTTQTIYYTTYGAFPRTWNRLGNTGNQFRAVVFTDVAHPEVIYLAGDQTVPVKKLLTDGSISSIPYTASSSVGLCVYNDRLWGWGAVGFGNYLYFSNLSSAVGSNGGDSLADTANGGGTIIVRTFSASAIRCCAPVNGSLLIVHDRGISVLTGWGQSDIAVQPQALNASIGMGNATPDGLCIGNETTTGDIAFFVTPVGIYMTNGGYVRPVGTPQKPDPTAALLIAGTVDPSMFCLRFNSQFNEVWVEISGIGIYIYNLILASWSGPFTGSYASGFRTMFQVEDSSTGAQHMWRVAFNGTAGNGAIVSECDRTNVYKDDVAAAGTGGTAITSVVQLKRMFAGDRSFSKSWRWINLMATLTNGATVPVVTASSQIGSNTQSLTNISSIEQMYYVSPGGTGPWLDVSISDAGATGPSSYAMATVQGNLLGQR